MKKVKMSVNTVLTLCGFRLLTSPSEDGKGWPPQTHRGITEYGLCYIVRHFYSNDRNRTSVLGLLLDQLIDELIWEKYSRLFSHNSMGTKGRESQRPKVDMPEDFHQKSGQYFIFFFCPLAAVVFAAFPRVRHQDRQLGMRGLIKASLDE